MKLLQQTLTGILFTLLLTSVHAVEEISPPPEALPDPASMPTESADSSQAPITEAMAERKSETMNNSSKDVSQQAEKHSSTSTVADQKNLALTVYNSNLGLVKDTRSLKLPNAVSQLRFMDVAQQINPTTVHIKSLSEPDKLNIIEQNYEYDLLNPQKLLDKYVGQPVTLVLRKLDNNTETLTPTTATLLANNEGQVWRVGEQIVINPSNIAEIRFDKLPENLIAKPTLVWTLENTGQDNHTVEASYMTNGLNWHADYVLVIGQDDSKADLNGWVTVENHSGATYQNAELKLVAGNLNRVQPEAPAVLMQMDMAEAASKRQFQEQGLFEYHLYTLQRPTILKNNETKQISLLSAANFGVKKTLSLNGQPQYFYGYNNPGVPIKEKIVVQLEFKNSESNSLGQPLPAGVMRAYKADTSGSQQFVGESRIEHTPKDEILHLDLGEAFDVVAERKQTDYKIISKRVTESSYELRLRNHKPAAVTVIVNEPISGDWELLNPSHPAEKVSASSVRFSLTVGKDAETVLTYKLRIKT